MRIDHVVVTATADDAITSHALRVHDASSAVAEGDVFALHIDPATADRVRPFDELGRIGGEGPVVYHASTGSPPIVQWLRETRRPVVVEHHALGSPPDEVSALAPLAKITITDSARHAAALAAAGYGDVRVLAPVMPIDELLAREPHGPTVNHMQTVVSGPVVLSVARFLPHERLDRLIEAYHVLTSHHRPDARLIIVGAAQDPEYAEAIRRQVRELNLHGVWLRGSADDDELAAFLRHADLFATMSEDEGFCVPVIEAFAFGVPVLAARSGAMAGTVADAALLLAPDDGVAVAAEAMAELLTNDRLRDRLVQRGRARAEILAAHNTIRRRVELLSVVR